MRLPCHARSRAYRWGEDGIAGISDNHCHLCFSVAMWNTHDPIIKERLYGLTGNEGNHAEDVKELYYYLDSTPTHSYMKHLYKYPQAAFPYSDLVETNKRRSKKEPEYEILDTGVFADGRYFDVFTEYAKADEKDVLVKITVHNRADEAAPFHLLPTLLIRNQWSFLHVEKPIIELTGKNKKTGSVRVRHEQAGTYHLYFDACENVLFAENETNMERIFGQPNANPLVKDSINDAVVGNDYGTVTSVQSGTKCSPHYQFTIEGGASKEVRLRLSVDALTKDPLGKAFDKVFADRIREADEFYATQHDGNLNDDLINIQRQAFAGMMWSKQFYHIDIPTWLNGDPKQPAPPESRKKGRNSHWQSLNNEDIISMPDKWEYPWYAAWDLAFHCVPIAKIDPDFAKKQLILFLREWYMRPNGQIPAYEWKFGDVNPPVHAWACLKVYHIDKERKGKGDVMFLKRVFQKLLINFTWWVNKVDTNDNNIFEGGFLGLDNIGVFDRSAEIPGGGSLDQADGTSWMAMYSLNMLDMALEIAQTDKSFEDVATKFFEHFVLISKSLNDITREYKGAWDEEEGFFYDMLVMPDGSRTPLKVRSLVGLTTLFATMVMDKERLKNLPDFMTRFNWYREHRPSADFAVSIKESAETGDILLALVPRARLGKMLKALLDENEFFAPGGIRSLSKVHQDGYSVNIAGEEFGLKYEPAESSSYLFGGNSNWRGPIWMPMNYLLLESLRNFNHYASGTVSGANTRRYHGLLVASANPPTDRSVLVSKIEERIGDREDGWTELSANHYPNDAVHPRGFEHLTGFSASPVPTWAYDTGRHKLEKSVAMEHGSNTVIVAYTNTGETPFELTVTPFLVDRDYHGLFRKNEQYDFYHEEEYGQLKVYARYGASPLFWYIGKGEFSAEKHWIEKLTYVREEYRGLDFREDARTIGEVTKTMEPGETYHLMFSTEESVAGRRAGQLVATELKRLRAIREGQSDPFLQDLLVAGAQFVVRRASTDSYTILAGYHWFTDWGRDTMIAMRGLCIATGRQEVSASIISTFLHYLNEGMLPNRFPDDTSKEVEYNTVDATLWLFVALYEYALAFNDLALVKGNMDKLSGIIQYHLDGTRYNIQTLDEGFLYAGEDGVQLTWMDAKVDGFVVTPRRGCPVEIQALWYNALKIYLHFAEKTGSRENETYKRAEATSKAVKKNFKGHFLNEAGYLNDVVVPGKPADESMRPNQLYVLSLPFPLLSKADGKSVFKAVREQLYTPFGENSCKSVKFAQTRDSESLYPRLGRQSYPASVLPLAPASAPTKL